MQLEVIFPLPPDTGDATLRLTPDSPKGYFVSVETPKAATGNSVEIPNIPVAHAKLMLLRNSIRTQQLYVRSMEESRLIEFPAGGYLEGHPRLGLLDKVVEINPA